MARKEVPQPHLPPASTVLSPDKEIELLIKSIEESSKHCRETLIALLVASFYILITVFSYSVTDKVKLPLVGLDVPDNHSLIESEPGFRAIPFDEFSDCMIVGSL